MAKNKSKDAKRAFLVKEAAKKNGKAARSIYRMIEGTQDNDEVLADFSDLNNAIDICIDAYHKNKLVAAVEALVPFQ